MLGLLHIESSVTEESLGVGHLITMTVVAYCVLASQDARAATLYGRTLPHGRDFRTEQSSVQKTLLCT